MRVRVEAILSEREFGTIFAVCIDDQSDARHGMRLRVKAASTIMLGGPAVGETWVVEGDLRAGPYGNQIEATAARRTVPSGRLIVAFLASHADGIGPERAERLWRAFGPDLGRVLSSPDNIPLLATAIAPDRPNLAPTLAAAAVRMWAEACDETRVVEWLADRGVVDLSIARRVAKVFGPKAVERLETNPYVLVPLVSWAKLDELALRLLSEAGVVAPHADRSRLVGAVDDAVKAVIREGDTAVPDARLRELVAARLKVKPNSQRVQAAVDAGVVNAAVVEGGGLWRAPGCALMEDVVAERVVRMVSGDYPSPVPVPDRAELVRLLNGIQSLYGALHEEQSLAAALVLSRAVACLQGGAGVGKTHTLRAICDVWEKLGGQVFLCALAGKAALRLARSTKRHARTIARALGELDRRQAAEEKLKAGSADDGLAASVVGLAELTAETLLVVDEASMLDLPGLHALLRRLPEGGRLLMVGDEAQLPPVGMGLVFGQLVPDERITVRLTQVHRQAASTGIPQAAAGLRSGKLPDFVRYDGAAIGVALVQVPASEVAEVTCSIHRELGGADGGVQILTATNDGEAGVRALNRRLHDAHVARVGGPVVRGSFGNLFAVGDPVVHLRNRYDIGLFNGLIGRVVAVHPEDRSVSAYFDGFTDPHRFGPDDLLDVGLAYALTCHKLQGSQARRVVIPLYGSRVLDQSWIYTALTRAEEQVVFVGFRHLMEEAMDRPTAAARRVVGFRWPPEPGFSANRAQDVGAGEGNRTLLTSLEG